MCDREIFNHAHSEKYIFNTYILRFDEVKDTNCSNCQKSLKNFKKSVDRRKKVWYSNIAVGNGSEITKEKIKK